MPATPRLLARRPRAPGSSTRPLNPGYQSWAELFPPLQDSVLAAAEATGARLVAMENVYMYGPTGGRPLTEELPYAATTRKGRTRAQMAEDLLEAHRRGRVEVAIGRASDFFGPGACSTQPPASAPSIQPSTASPCT